MKDEREPTEFWKVELLSFDLKTLGKTDGLSVVLFFGLWEVCVSFKKVSEGTSEVFEFLLKALGIGIVEPEVVGLLFEVCEKFAQLGEREGLFGLLIGLDALLKRPVVDKTSMAELNSQGGFLFDCRLDTVLKRLIHHFSHTPFCCAMDCFTVIFDLSTLNMG